MKLISEPVQVEDNEAKSIEPSARPPRLTPQRMYSILLAGDPAFNGRFFTGVLTTGIYCLPSCKARKPKLNNVRFYRSVEEARAAGLRPCRKCHPDDFARGADPVLECIEALVAEVRANPAAFPDARTIVRRSGFGATRLFELVRQHYHSTPADVLVRARLDKAKQLLVASDDPLASVAFDAGWEGLSAFHEHFRRMNGLTPAAYRELKARRRFEIALPPDYPLPYLRRALSRDTHSVTERFAKDTYLAGLALEGGPAVLKLQLEPNAVGVEIEGGTGFEAHDVVVGLLGLEQNAGGFARLALKLGFARLMANRAEMRLSQTHSVFEGLVWAVLGQQVNFAFTCQLKRRLVERAGVLLGEGLYAPPTPSAVAGLTATDLASLQFSRQKSEYVIALARRVVEGKLDLEALRHGSATRVERTLVEVRGLGPWSVHYVMMRALGFADCVPLGDTALASALEALLHLEARPDVPSVRRLMAVFSPFRSLATAHLWQFNKPAPL